MKLIVEKPNKKFYYVLKVQRVDPNDPEDKQAQDRKDQIVFKMRSLSGDDRVQIANFDVNGARLAYALIMGLTGWENAKYPDGTDIVFPSTDDGNCDASKVVEWFPKYWVELAHAVVANTTMTGDEVKN